MHHLPSETPLGVKNRVEDRSSSFNQPAIVLADEPTTLDTKTGANNGLVNQANQEGKPLSWLHTSQNAALQTSSIIRDGGDLL